MKSSQLECFRDTVAHRYPKQILFYASFTGPLDRTVRQGLKLGADVNLGEHFGMFGAKGIGLRPPPDRQKPDFSRYFKDVEIPPGAFINHLGVLETPGSLYHFTHYTSPLRNAARMRDLEDFSYPSVQGFRADSMKAGVEAAHAEGRAAVTWVGHMYEDTWQIRGYEPFLMDMVERPEWCEYILDRLTERNLANAVAAAKAGVDYLTTGDDVANQRALMFSLEQWRHFMKPRWAKVYAAARAIKPDIQIWYHSDGNIESIIPELMEIGVTILNPIQPECLDPLMVKRKYGKKLTLDGAIGTQTTMPFGPPADVRQAVKQVIEQLGKDGGFILSPTHVLEPEVPLDNIQAFVDAAKEFGAK